ncbi:MAG: sporulation protein YqfC [Clostridia bacterium]|nr:sporulation protein YqfC [Clostridia bacterium]
MPDNRSARRRKKDNNENPKNSLKEKVTEILELPKEVVLNVPKITMIGRNNLIIENYKGIIEYDERRIRVNTGIGILKITGERMAIKEITSEDIMVEGELLSIEVLK